MKITQATACMDSFAAHDRDRGMFQTEFCRRLMREPGLDGAVLDIGCGGGLPPGLAPLRERLKNLDGVDPSPEVMGHPLLKQRWHGEFEKCELPAGRYDLAYAYNVAEHIAEAEPFFRRLRRVLKPGGVFWALTPHSLHPFVWCVRLIQKLGLKGRAAAQTDGINEYPSYYRLNSRSAVARAAGRCGFEKLDLVYMPCLQWDTYMPRPLRFTAHVYDRLLGLRDPRFMLLLAYRLQ